MGLAKEVQFKDRKVRVETIKVGAMVRLQSEGRSRNLGELMLASLKQEDKEYIESIDYEGKATEDEIEKLLAAFKEVNPEFFRKKEGEVPSETLPVGG